MIALLREIIRLLGGLFGQADDNAKALNTRFDAQDKAIEHLRVLIEGDNQPTVTGISITQEGNH